MGALNAATIAMYPSLAGAQLLRQTWLSQLARDVFTAHPLGILLNRLRGRGLSALPATNVIRLIQRQTKLLGVDSFEQLRVPLEVLATDVGLGVPHIFKAGFLEPALQASTAIPGVFPAVTIDGREYMDGGIIDNTPLSVAVEGGSKDVVAISLMAGGELERAPAGWADLMARTLQLSLHHRMLADFERLRGRGRVVVLCPVLGPDRTWSMAKDRVEALIESSRLAAARLLAQRGSRLFRYSGIHYMEAS